MKTRMLIGLMAACAIGICSSKTLAQCDKTWIGPTFGSWHEDEYWTPSVEPGTTDDVCIGDDAYVFIDGEAHARSIHLQRHPLNTDRGRIDMLGGELHLYAASKIDGDLVMVGSAELILENSLTLQGDRGTIRGEMSGSNKPVIEVGTKLLTLEGADEPRDESLVLHGALRIHRDDCPSTCQKYFLYNNAWIVADDATEPINIDATADPGTVSSGSNGHWVAEAGAELVFNNLVEVRGSGAWILEDDENSEITLNRASTLLTGPVTLKRGKLNLNANFATAGNLEFIPPADEETYLIVKEGVTAEFGN